MDESLKAIYTEQIHHISCGVCGTHNYTMQSFEMKKRQASYSFRKIGWQYSYQKHFWICPDCQDTNSPPGREVKDE